MALWFPSILIPIHQCKLISSTDPRYPSSKAEESSWLHLSGTFGSLILGSHSPAQPDLCKLLKLAKGEGRGSSTCGESTPIENECITEVGNTWSCVLQAHLRGQYANVLSPGTWRCLPKGPTTKSAEYIQ